MKNLLLALTFLTFLTTTAQADSLVCQYFVGNEYRTLVYTEVEDPKPNQVRTAWSHGRIMFGDRSVIQLSSTTECVFIDDIVGGDQVALDYFLEQIGYSGLD